MTCEPSLGVDADAHRKVCWDRGYVVRSRYGKKTRIVTVFWCSHPRFHNAYPRLILIGTVPASRCEEKHYARTLPTAVWPDDELEGGLRFAFLERVQR